MRRGLIVVVPLRIETIVGIVLVGREERAVREQEKVEDGVCRFVETFDFALQV